MDIKLTLEEVETLRLIFSKLCIRRRTGELGFLHGLDRFVSLQIVLKKTAIEVLENIAKKIGLNEITKVA
jgi:hypothetical protein